MAGELLSGQGLDKGQGGLLGQGGRAHVSAPAVEGQGFEPFEIDVTCIDNGMPLVLIRASDMGRTGYETVAKLNADTDLKICLEALRLKTGQLMGLGDVAKKTYPKIKLLALLLDGGSLTTRSFISHVHHDAIGVLAAVTVGTVCVLDGSVIEGHCRHATRLKLRPVSLLQGLIHKVTHTIQGQLSRFTKCFPGQKAASYR